VSDCFSTRKWASTSSLYIYLFFVLGAEPTIVQCIRNFVTEHSNYKQDYVVSETINYDLLKLIQDKTEKCETLSTAKRKAKSKSVLLIQ
jgi:hypothetical protein